MMLEMRTTLTLDDDVAGLLKRRARELGIPFKEAVNRTIRAGLGEATMTRRHPAPKTISHSFGFRPGIDLDKLPQFADELEAEAFADRNTVRGEADAPSKLQDPAARASHPVQTAGAIAKPGSRVKSSCGCATPRNA